MIQATLGKGRKKGRMTMHREFVLISALIILTVFSLSVSFSYRLYDSIVDRLAERAKSDAEQLDAYLHEHFEYTGFLVGQLGKDILDHGHHDLEYIANALQKFTDDTSQLTMLSTSVFSWADRSDNIIVKSDGSIISDDPIDAHHRAYIQKGREEPWKVHFAPPARGIVSGKLVVPAGMGIADEKGRYICTLAFGFLQGRMVKKIKDEIISPGFQFALYDENNMLALKSYEDGLLEDDLEVLDLLDEARKWRASAGLIRSPSLITQESEYCYFQRSLYHPYLILITFDRDQVVREVIPIMVRTVIELMLFGSLIILLLIWAQRRFIQPVMKLSNMAEQVAAKPYSAVSSKSRRSEVSDSYEISQLTQQFDRVRYVEELERIRKELTFKSRQSEARKEELENAIRGRASLLAKMGKELLVPARALRDKAEGMAQQMFGPIQNKQYQAHAEGMHEESLRLEQLIEEIIDLAQIDADTLPLNTSKINLTTLFQSVEELLLPEARSRQITLQMNAEADLPVMRGDYERIHQVIEHIGRYEILSAPPEGVVTLTALYHNHNNLIEIIAAHNGRGMTKEAINRLMERYSTKGLMSVQLEEEDADSHNWRAEVGLLLARRLTEYMGGSFKVEAVADKGTRFVVTFIVNAHK